MSKLDKKKMFLIGLGTILVCFMCLFFIVRAVFNLKGKSGNISYIGTSNDQISYQVFMKENSYIEDKVLPSSFSYLTPLVDKIKLQFHYDYQYDRILDLNYDYRITATIVSVLNTETTNNVSKPIWTKEYLLTPSSEVRKISKEIKEDKEVTIDLTGYNDLVSNFTTDYGVNLTTALEVKLEVHYKGTVMKKPREFTHYLLASIPLGVKAFEITPSKNFEAKEIVYATPPPKKDTSYVTIILSIVGMSVTIFGAITWIRRKMNQYQSEYVKARDTILKEYDSRLVEVKNFVKYEKWDMVDVTSFSELINLSNEAFEPIFYWERTVNHQRDAWFCILREKVLYRYLLEDQFEMDYRLFKHHDKSKKNN